ncbi:MAG: hypothetical protein R2856_18015 [Caldilineaceae bacterium]
MTRPTGCARYYRSICTRCRICPNGCGIVGLDFIDSGKRRTRTGARHSARTPPATPRPTPHPRSGRIPFRRNEHLLSARRDDLARPHSVLGAETAGHSLRAGLTGQGGIGSDATGGGILLPSPRHGPLP